MSRATDAELEERAGQVLHVTREEFIADYWDYRAGEHVTIIGPSGSGKTQWSMDLLGHTARPELQGFVIVVKQRDVTVDKFAKQHNFRVLRQWPPPKRLPFQKPPAGYVVWPAGHPQAAVEKQRQAHVIRRTIEDLYWSKRKCIILADEVYTLEKELKLIEEINRVHTKGRGMDTGLWSATQRPALISQWAYQAHHMFLAFDPDKRARERYAEIAGGLDPRLIEVTAGRLAQYEYLYLHRDSRSMCIVGAS